MADSKVNLDLHVEKQQSRSQNTKSASSLRSRIMREKKDSLDELQEILKQREEVLRKKMAIMDQISTIESGESGDSQSLRIGEAESEKSAAARTVEWVSSQSSHLTFAPTSKYPAAAPVGPAAEPPPPPEAPPNVFPGTSGSRFTEKSADGAHYSQQLSTSDSVSNGRQTNVIVSSDINKLACALQNTIKCAISYKDSNLPNFDGNSKDWLQFKASFHETTKKYDIQPADNLRRLRLALKGEARSSVAALLHACADPESIISALQLRFGHPSRIIKDLISDIKKLRVTSDPRELSVFAAKVSDCVVSIKALNMSEYLYNIELYEHIITKMTEQLRAKWLDYAANSDSDCKLVCVANFLQREAERSLQYLPDVAPRSSGASHHPGATPAASTGRNQQYNQTRYPVNATKSQSVCQFCNDCHHELISCEKFSQLHVDDRWQWVRANKKCFRCLKYTHPAKLCRISKYLHKLLHRPKPSNVDCNIQNNVTDVNTEPVNPKVMSVNSIGALLKVVPVSVQGRQGWIRTYALLDEGATISLVDSSLAEQLGAEGPSEVLNIEGIGSSRQSINSMRLKVKIENSTGSQFCIGLRSMANLNLQSQHLSKSELVSHTHVKEVEHLIHWYTHATPRILIGQDNWHLIVTRKLYSGAINEPVVSETLLGFVVHGCSGSEKAHRSPHKVAHLHVERESADLELHSLVKSSFELDSIGVSQKQRANPDEERALNILKNTTRKINNRWETGLLWAKEDVDLPDSSAAALRRFYNLEAKLKKNPISALAYSAQINRLFELGFAELCHDPSVKGKEWVLPHFAAINPNKPGKVRIVFDCAGRVDGVSLNDNLLPGPDLLQNLLNVLWQFRQGLVAVAGDIKDMFMRIKIRKEDQAYQKFYWREVDDTSPPKVYVMTSMLFGATCSPSSAIYVKNLNAQEFVTCHPGAVHAIERNHYVDDYLDSFQTEDEAIKMASEIIKIHESGGFEVRNWASNSTIVLQSIPVEKRAHGKVELTPDATTVEKTLGMMWQPATDTLSFNLSMNRVPQEVSSGKAKPTKRQMLAVIMSIYDPLGLLSAFSIRGRILLQEVWRSKIGWDEQLLDEEQQKWQLWITELRRIKECTIPRCYRTRIDKAKFIQLHTFCDASTKAYATACYLRLEYEDGEIKTVLVAAKARVTPLKPTSIPRLELQAALLGARLAHSVAEGHTLQIDERYFWSDSITTLAWIRSDPRQYKAYVGHRLAAIDDLSMVSQWRWVPTEFNSADIPTRDSTHLDLFPEGPWFGGPEFLKRPKEEWPVEKTNRKIVSPPEATCEEKQKVFIVTKREYSLPEVTAFSSWRRLIRATAYILLFVSKCKKEQIKGLTLELLEKAEKLWIKKVQEDCYAQELLSLQNKSNLPSDSKILQLSPVLDNDGIIRLGGRISRAPNVSSEVKFPVILSGNHAYTKLMVYDYHKRYNHGSTETVVNEIRQKYWLTNMRSTIRGVAHSCQFCKIKRARVIQPPMGDLPHARLQHHQRPFTFCGLDYFGPVEVAIGRRREKRWVALFTCMVTRAVHIEVAASLTSDSVIMAIRRMIARRGHPTALYSDNGTNFKGGDVELKKAWQQVDKEAISTDMLNRGIEWHFNPPTAAHMGGVWERLVQSIKKALSATLHERAPRDEVLSTLLAEAEHTVNSRPLTYVPVDPRDPEAITPNHFLIGSSSGAPVPGKFDDKDLLLRKQWRISQRLADMFWSRWVKEYLPTLINRKMKNTADQDIKVGSLVIIADSSLPRNTWPRGIILKTFPGNDNRVRVVEVKTAGGVFRRPVNKIVLLPTTPT